MRAMRRILLSAAAVCFWLGVSAGPASAHTVSGSGATNFHTNLTGITPASPGLEVKVIESGSRLQLENRTGKEVTVLGYKDEPYLRIGPDGVFQNKLSPATYINKSRKGSEPPEAARNAKVGDVDWEKVSSEPLARWHDHRIHWMLPTNPPEVRASPGKRHVVDAEWVVPIKAGAETINVKGDLIWEPGPSALPWYLVILACLALVIVVGRAAAWAPGLAAVTAVVVVIDVLHNIGLGLAYAGDIGYRLGKAVTQGPLALVAWVVGILAVVWLLRRGRDGLPLAALAGLQVALIGGVGDLNVLSRSEVPFGFGTGLARLAVAASIGLGFGLAVAAVLRLTGVVLTTGAPARAPSDEPLTAPAGP
jgi:hypothetical protein